MQFASLAPGVKIHDDLTGLANTLFDHAVDRVAYLGSADWPLDFFNEDFSRNTLLVDVAMIEQPISICTGCRLARWMPLGWLLLTACTPVDYPGQSAWQAPVGTDNSPRNLLSQATEARGETIEQGLVLLYLGSPGEAAPLLERLAGASESAVERATAVALHGLACLLSGDHERAQDLSKLASELDADGRYARILTAQLKLASGNLDQAEQALASVLEESPSQPLGLFTRAAVRLSSASNLDSTELRRVRQAVESDLTAAIEAVPNFALAYLSRATLALPVTRRAGQQGPSFDVEPQELGVTEQEVESGMRDVEHAIELNPELPNVYFVKALLREALTDSDAVLCIPDWCRALHESPVEHPFLPKLVQSLFFPEVHAAPGALADIEQALRTLDAAGQQVMLDFYIRSEALAVQGISRLDSLAEKGKLPPELVARMASVKQCHAAASLLIYRVRN